MQLPEAKFIVPDWGKSRLWYRAVDFIPLSGTMNRASEYDSVPAKPLAG
jgi:hypothetical protein